MKNPYIDWYGCTQLQLPLRSKGKMFHTEKKSRKCIVRDPGQLCHQNIQGIGWGNFFHFAVWVNYAASSLFHKDICFCSWSIPISSSPPWTHFFHAINLDSSAHKIRTIAHFLHFGDCFQVAKQSSPTSRTARSMQSRSSNLCLEVSSTHFRTKQDVTKTTSLWTQVIKSYQINFRSSTNT